MTNKYGRSYIHLNQSKFKDELIIEYYNQEHGGRSFSEFAKTILFEKASEELGTNIGDYSSANQPPTNLLGDKNHHAPSTQRSSPRPNIASSSGKAPSSFDKQHAPSNAPNTGSGPATDIGDALDNLGI